MNLGFLTKDVRISTSKFTSVVILVSASFAWLFMFFNWFRDIFEFYIPNSASVNNGYFLFLGVATFSAIAGSVLSERINRRKFLITWIFIGLISNIFLIFIQELGLIFFYIISAILGISIALGFPSCLAFLADSTTIEERARVTGISIFVTLIIAMFSYSVVGSTLEFGIEPLILLCAVKGTTLFAFVSGDWKRKKSEKIISWKKIFTTKDFTHYLIPWLMFSFAGSLNNLIFINLTETKYLDVDLIANLLHYLTWAIFALISGSMADRIGRKQPIIIGLTSLGVSYAIFGTLTSPETFILYQTLSGIAWGFIFTVYMTLLGDLASYGSKEKFYAMGAIMPMILTLSFNALIGLFGVSAPISVLSPIFSMILFLSIIPVFRATETLPRKKIRDIEMKEHIEKISKIIDETKKQNGKK